MQYDEFTVFRRKSQKLIDIYNDLLRKLFFLAFPTFISYNYFKTDMCTDLTGKGREFYGKYAKYAEKKRR